MAVEVVGRMLLDWGVVAAHCVDGDSMVVHWPALAVWGTRWLAVSNMRVAESEKVSEHGGCSAVLWELGFAGLGCVSLWRFGGVEARGLGLVSTWNGLAVGVVLLVVQVLLMVILLVQVLLMVILLVQALPVVVLLGEEEVQD